MKLKIGEKYNFGKEIVVVLKLDYAENKAFVRIIKGKRKGNAINVYFGELKEIQPRIEYEPHPVRCPKCGTTAPNFNPDLPCPGCDYDPMNFKEWLNSPLSRSKF